MRYVVLVLMGVFSALLSGTAFCTSFELAGVGIQIDLVLLFALALVFLEKNSITPILFAALTGLLLDILFSTTLGMYALSYTVAAAAASFAVHKLEKINFLHIFVIGVGGYIVKELMMALIVFAQGARQFDMGTILLRDTLPSAAANGVLLLLVYLLISILYQNAWMRPRVAAHFMDEL